MGKFRSDKGYSHASNLHCPKLEENIYPLYYQREKWSKKIVMYSQQIKQNFKYSKYI